jgi:predicted nucleic acid-binding protein
MAANIIDIKSYSPKSSDVYFFDNNVWMYLFCPLGNYQKNRQKSYSMFLKSIQSSKGTIFINSLVLSEFTNRYLRMDFEQWKKETNNHGVDYKKAYVGTPRYIETAKEIKLQIKSILSFCEKSSDNFNAINLDNVLTHFESIDFNDSYYIEFAQLDNMIFVTDDKDFTNYSKHNLSVVTFKN